VVRNEMHVGSVHLAAQRHATDRHLPHELVHERLLGDRVRTERLGRGPRARKGRAVRIHLRAAGEEADDRL